MPVKHRPWRFGIAHIAAAVIVRGLRPLCASSNIPIRRVPQRVEEESTDLRFHGANKGGRLALQTWHKVPSNMHDADIEAGSR